MPLKVGVFPDAEIEIQSAFDHLEEAGYEPSEVAFFAPATYFRLAAQVASSRGKALSITGRRLREYIAPRTLLQALRLAEQGFSQESIWNFWLDNPFVMSDRLTAIRDWRKGTSSPELLEQRANALTQLAQLVALPNKASFTNYSERCDAMLRGLLGENPPNEFEADEIRAYEMAFETVYSITGDEIAARSAFVRKLDEALNAFLGREGMRITVPGSPQAEHNYWLGALDNYESVCDLSSGDWWVGVSRTDIETDRPAYASIAVTSALNKTNPEKTSARKLLMGHDVAGVSFMPSFEEFVRTTEASRFKLIVDAFDGTTPTLDRAAEVIDSRDSDKPTEFDGFVGRPDFELVLGSPASSQTLNEFDQCGFRAFLHKELKLFQRGDEDDTIFVHPLDKGRILHRVLEQFFRQTPRREEAAQGWSDEELQLVPEIIDGVLSDEIIDDELLSKPVWKAQRSKLERVVINFLELDQKFRKDNGVVQAASELRFGGSRDVWPAVQISNTFTRGSIDRIDISPDESRVIVSDYKTGMPHTFDFEIPHEDGSQLPLYAEAVQQQFPDATVEAAYWYVSDTTAERPGFVYDSHMRRAFVEHVADLESNYSAGEFAPNPGGDGFFGYLNCSTCEFDGLCTEQRQYQFDSKWAETEDVE